MHTFELPFLRARVRGPESVLEWLSHSFADVTAGHALGAAERPTIEITVETLEATAGQAAWMVENRLETELLERRGDRVAFHAGGVVSEGRVGLLAGRSGAGKTTATLRLVEQGLPLHCEELAIIGATAGDTVATDLVVPYPRALSVRPPVRALARDPERLRVLDDQARYRPAHSSTAPAEVGSLALVEFEEGAEPVMERLSPADAVIEVLGQCFEPLREQPDDPGQPNPEAMFDRVISFVERTPVYRLRYGTDEAAEATLRSWTETL